MVILNLKALICRHTSKKYEIQQKGFCQRNWNRHPYASHLASIISWGELGSGTTQWPGNPDIRKKISVENGNHLAA